MNPQRLLEMGLAEVAVRGRQEVSKWRERITPARKDNGQFDLISTRLASERCLAQIQARARQGDVTGAAEMLLNRFRESSAGRFFEGVVSDDTPNVLATRVSWARDEVVTAAEAVCQRRFDLLGYRGLFFGDPVDWHLDPISHRRAPLVHWSRLDLSDSAMVGDEKVVLELNRHQWLVRLGQAYQLTGDEQYAQAFKVYVRKWMQANPPGLGINWASSLEVALRLISWCWALFLFRNSPVLSPQFFATMATGIWAHATHIEKYLSTYSSPNTHLTGEALGLFYGGILFHELRGADRWRMLGTRILTAEIERHVLPDGVYFEQSTCYQRYTVDIYLHFLILASRNGLTIPAMLGERVQRMLDFLLAVRSPGGSMPQIGDADGGSLLPLASRTPDDFRGAFSTAAAFFDRSDYAWAAGGLAPETVWLLGAGGAKAFHAASPCSPEASPSRVFADGGYVVMRSGWDPHAHHLIFDMGPLGCPISAGHGHADLLSIHCSVFGEPYLVDPGTYCYSVDPEWRDAFRGTAAHSTVVVDGVGQAVPAGPFKWEVRPRAQLHRWQSSEAFDFADASHEAYCRLSDPVRHRRRVLFVKPRFWVVVDDLEGAEVHALSLRFQLAPMEVELETDLWAKAYGPGGRALFIRPFATVQLKGQVHKGQVAPIEGWISPNYGQRVPAPLLTYSAVARLPLRIITLLQPMHDALAPLPNVSPLLSDARGPLGITLRNTGETLRFDNLNPILEQR